jgi:hypothetical protein
MSHPVSTPVPGRHSHGHSVPSPRAPWRYAAVVCLCLVAGPASAQLLPSTPLNLFGGRLAVSGSLSASVGPSDDRAYYNLTDYDSDLLRMAQVSIDASLRLSPRAEIVIGLDGVTPVDRWRWHAYASNMHVAFRPVARGSLTVRAGILEPPFGVFLRHSYGAGNLLIGYPLAYHYATTVRADAFPATADDILRRRSFGAVVSYPLGDSYRASGLPLVNPFGWNAGVQVEAGRAPLHATVALTRGGVASRLGHDAPGGWVLTGRVASRPSPGFAVGISATHGAFVGRDWGSLAGTAVYNGSPRETALSADAEYSRGYWLVRGEAIANRRTLPAFRAPYLSAPLWTGWMAVETRYKLFPGMYLAARLERLSFSSLSGATSTDTWDANVTRLEAGGGYSLGRNTLVKLSYQRNRRDSTWYPRQQLVSAQVVLWF